MSANFDETIGELKDLLHDLRNLAEQTGYGFFPGGDPRTFTPDPECSTESERAAWASDCERFERGEQIFTRTSCYFERTDAGVNIVTPSGYGQGTYTMTDEELGSICERLDRIVSQMEAATDPEES